MAKETKETGKQSLKENLDALKNIVDWFDQQEEVDVEEGLKKVREGASLVKVTKARLAEIENEFEEIQRDIEKDNLKQPTLKTQDKALEIDYSDQDIDVSNIPF